MSRTTLAAISKAFLRESKTRLIQVRHSSSYKPPANWRLPHLDELPIPEGSWSAHYKMKQKSYNRQLIIGTIVFIGTVTFIVKSDKFFFNFYPPDLDERELCTFTPPVEAEPECPN